MAAQGGTKPVLRHGWKLVTRSVLFVASRIDGDDLPISDSINRKPCSSSRSNRLIACLLIISPQINSGLRCVFDVLERRHEDTNAESQVPQLSRPFGNLFFSI